MCQHEFQEYLRPALRAELRRPGGQWFVLNAREQVAVLECPIDDDRDTFVGAQWQQTLLGLASGDRIVELHEVEFLTPDEVDEVRV